MAQAHPVQGAGPVQPGGGGHGDHVEHASHPGARTYLFIFVILAIVTALEVAVAVEPLRSIVPQLPALLGMAVIKGLLIVAFYMHLKTDSRVFTALFTVG
jgi:cytochrome c oxidase subunit IV